MTNEQALLALIADLYRQIAALQAEIANSKTKTTGEVN